MTREVPAHSALPRCPGVPQIVPVEISDIAALQRMNPRLVVRRIQPHESLSCGDCLSYLPQSVRRMACSCGELGV